MALSVKHAFQTLQPDDPAKDVSADEWNQDHALTGVLDVANGGTGTTTGAPGVLVSDTPPVGAPDNSLWWESDSGLLYLRFNDGTSTQWVLAAPQPDISVLATYTYVDAADTALTTSKVAKVGDVMTGTLTMKPPTGGGYINVDNTETAQQAFVQYLQGGSLRWLAGKQTDDNYLIYSLAAAEVLNINYTTGLAVIKGNPTAALGIATKQYADLKVAKTGDTMTGDLTPAVNGAVNLGSAALRWGTVFTSDLDLNNGVGDWTIVEGEDELFIYNNKRGKTYKFVMIEVNPSRVTPKKV